MKKSIIILMFLTFGLMATGFSQSADDAQKASANTESTQVVTGLEKKGEMHAKHGKDHKCTGEEKAACKKEGAACCDDKKKKKRKKKKKAV